MADKRDYYTILGVAKTASVEDIKKAYKKIAMRYHPDMLAQRNASDAEKKEAAVKLQEAIEAEAVLTDPAKRSTYDTYGHAGIENLKNSGSSGASTPTSSGPVRKKEAHSDTSTWDYFEKVEERMHRDRPTDTGAPRKSAAERAAESAEARRRAREEARGKPSTPPVATPPSSGQPPLSVTFQDAADGVADATDRLKGVTPSLEDLQKLRNNLQTLLNEVDSIIARSPKSNTPRP